MKEITEIFHIQSNPIHFVYLIYLIFLRFFSVSIFSLTFSSGRQLTISRPEDLHRFRVEHMERQLANLTGLVQKALTQNVPAGGNANQNYLAVPGQYRGKFLFLLLLLFRSFDA